MEAVVNALLLGGVGLVGLRPFLRSTRPEAAVNKRKREAEDEEAEAEAEKKPNQDADKITPPAKPLLSSPPAGRIKRYRPRRRQRLMSPPPPPGEEADDAMIATAMEEQEQDDDKVAKTSNLADQAEAAVLAFRERCRAQAEEQDRQAPMPSQAGLMGDVEDYFLDSGGEEEEEKPKEKAGPPPGQEAERAGIEALFPAGKEGEAAAAEKEGGQLSRNSSVDSSTQLFAKAGGNEPEQEQCEGWHGGCKAPAVQPPSIQEKQQEEEEDDDDLLFPPDAQEGEGEEEGSDHMLLAQHSQGSQAGEGGKEKEEKEEEDEQQQQMKQEVAQQQVEEGKQPPKQYQAGQEIIEIDDESSCGSL